MSRKRCGIPRLFPSAWLFINCERQKVAMKLRGGSQQCVGYRAQALTRIVDRRSTFHLRPANTSDSRGVQDGFAGQGGTERDV